MIEFNNTLLEIHAFLTDAIMIDLVKIWLIGRKDSTHTAIYVVGQKEALFLDRLSSIMNQVAG